MRAPAIVFLLALLATCGKEAPVQEAASKEEPAPAETEKPRREPDAIRVQHILIGFQDAVGFRGSAPERARTRTREQAEKLATELLERARSGEDFGTLVKEYTDDSAPGIYGMVNKGRPAKPGFTPRNQMVPAFGDTGFPLEVGEIGMAPYDPERSPYGWHIVKRIE